MRRIAAASAVAAISALVVGSCAELPDAPSGRCGNRVVDLAEGEECDTYGEEPGTECGAPGEARACRYACALRADGVRAPCPSWMACGSDGTCRAPSGSFAPAADLPAVAPRELYAGDLDGDGRSDLVTIGAREIRANFLGEGRELADAFSIDLDSVWSSFPAVADLSGDGRLDIVFEAADGILVALGDDDRTLTATAYPSLTLSAATTDVRIIPLEVLPDQLGLEVVLIGTTNDTSALVNLDGVSINLLAVMPGPPSGLAGGSPVANLDERPESPCDEFVLAYAGAEEVLVYSPCKEIAPGRVGWNTSITPLEVHLSGGATVTRGPLLVDANADGRQDILIEAAACSGCSEIEVAYGVGDGTFHSDPSAIPASSGDQSFSQYPLIPAPLPLAVADLNADGVPDYVTQAEIRVSDVEPGGAVSFTLRGVSGAVPWTAAVVADMNGNGVLDVLTGSSEGLAIGFFNGIGDGTLNPYDIATEGGVANLTIGDFDGDLISDLMVSEAPGTEASGAGGDTLAVLFGRATGAPEPPVRLGRLDSIRQIAATLGGGGITVDGITDTVAVSLDPDGILSFAAVTGRSDRLLRSPYIMVRSPEGSGGLQPFAVRRLAVGELDGDGHADVAALGQSIESGELRLWLIPSYDDARFASDRAKESEVLEGPLAWSACQMVPVDLDGDGLDELALLGPSTEDPGLGLVVVAHSVPDPAPGALPGTRVWQLGEAHPLGALVEHHEDGGPAPAQNGRVRLVDGDGDGRRDLVTVATVAEASSMTATPHAVIFWNDGTGALDAFTVIANPPEKTALDVVCLHADGRAGLEVAVLVDGGVHVAGLEGRVALATPSTPSVSSPGGRLIAAADLDLDGVDDIVVAGETAISIFRGRAVVP